VTLRRPSLPLPAVGDATAAVTQMMAESERLTLLDEIAAFVNEEFGGSITRPLVVTLTTAARS
jgi:hypothetical protein